MGTEHEVPGSGTREAFRRPGSWPTFWQLPDTPSKSRPALSCSGIADSQDLSEIINVSFWTNVWGSLFYRGVFYKKMTIFLLDLLVLLVNLSFPVTEMNPLLRSGSWHVRVQSREPRSHTGPCFYLAWVLTLCLGKQKKGTLLPWPSLLPAFPAMIYSPCG